MIKEAFGIVLRQERKKRNITQIELAYKANLDRTTVSLYERGLRKPGLEIILKLADGLGIEPGYLVDQVKIYLSNKQ